MQANLADLMNMVNPVNLVKLAGSLAKLESRLVDAQCLDAMVKRGWWNTQPRRCPQSSSYAAPRCGERRFDDFPFAVRFALRFGGQNDLRPSGWLF